MGRRLIVVTCRPVSRRWYQQAKTVGVLAFAAVTVGVAGWVLVHDPAPVRAVPSPAPTTTPSAEPVVSLWLGDSYTAGTGAGDLAHGEACQTALALGWVCRVDGQGGTGFVADGHVNSKKFAPLGDRLSATAAKYDPDVVVIDAGRNDSTAPKADVKAAAEAYFERVRQAWPHARLIAVAPYYLGRDDRPLGGWFAPFEKSLVEQYGGTFVDPFAEGWTTRALTGKDKLHPTPQGHAWIAEHLAPDLRQVMK
jgi:lysophospholipase L1-like esterase